MSNLLLTNDAWDFTKQNFLRKCIFFTRYQIWNPGFLGGVLNAQFRMSPVTLQILHFLYLSISMVGGHLQEHHHSGLSLVSVTFTAFKYRSLCTRIQVTCSPLLGPSPDVAIVHLRSAA